MKTIKKLVLAGLACLTATAYAATPKGPGTIANESSLSYSKNYPIPLNSYGIDQEAVQVVWSTPTVATTTFTDGSVSTFSITVTSSPQAGIANETVCVNSVCLADGLQWFHDSPVAQSSGTACSIAAAINANSILSTIMVSTCVAKGGASSLVSTTATVVGVGSNYATYSSSQSALTLNPYTSSSPVTGYGFGTMAGGSASSWTLLNGSATIISATNGYSPVGKTPMVALPVYYTQGTKVITGLSNGATVYIIPVSPGSFGLSSTSTGAVAGYAAYPTISTTNGTFIPLTSSQTLVTADNYTLTASTYSATTTVTWQISNDGVNWTNYASTGAFVLIPTYPSTNLAYDFGTQNFSYLQANVVRSGGFSGWSDGVQLLITVNGKNSGL